MTATISTKKPCCKVCFDAGKPESEYTSHWVRSLPDRTGKTVITCPTLLATKCRFCSKEGHTIKFCKDLEKYNKQRISEEKLVSLINQGEKDKKEQPKNKTNAFASLYEDTDSEEEQEQEEDDRTEYPALNNHKNKNTLTIMLPTVEPEVKTGWAAVVAKTLVIKKFVEPTRTGLIVLSDFIKTDELTKPKPKPIAKQAPWANKNTVTKKSWADESDSDDDELPEVDFVKYEIEDDTW